MKKLWIVLLVFILAACAPQERDLPFETIEQSDGLGWGMVEGQEHKLVVLTGPEDLEVLNELIPQPGRVVLKDPEEIAALGKEVPYPQWRMRNLDWDEYFAIIAFQGWKAHGGYSATINRIVQRGDSIGVYAHFKEPAPLEKVIDRTTSPLHAVKVWKDKRLVGRKVRFGLIVDDRLVASTSHFIP